MEPQRGSKPPAMVRGRQSRPAPHAIARVSRFFMAATRAFVTLRPQVSLASHIWRASQIWLLVAAAGCGSGNGENSNPGSAGRGGGVAGTGGGPAGGTTGGAVAGTGGGIAGTGGGIAGTGGGIAGTGGAGMAGT